MRKAGLLCRAGVCLAALSSLNFIHCFCRYKVLGPGGVKYHRACFRCTSCSRTLDSSSVTESKLGVMCKVCYAREFGPKGYGYAGGRAGVLSS